MAPSTKALFILPLTAVLFGCAGFHLYDEGRHKLVQEAQKSFDASDPLSVIRAERANLASLANEEIQVFDRLIAAALRRDWLRMLESDDPIRTSYLTNRIEARMAAIWTAPPPRDDSAEIHELFDSLVDLDSSRDSLVENASFLADNLGIVLPSCNTDQDLPEGLSEELKLAAHRASKDPEAEKLNLETLTERYAAYRKHCSNWRAALTQSHALASAGGGELGRAFDTWLEARNRLDAERIAANTAKLAFDHALQEYEAAAKQIEEALGPGKALEDLRKKAESFAAAVAKLEKDAGALGVDTIATEKIAALNLILLAAATSTVDEKKRETADGGSAEFRQALLVVAAIPEISEAVLALTAQGDSPSVAVLLLEKERQQILLAAAKRRVERQNERVELRWAQVEAFSSELSLLKQAHARALEAPTALGRPFVAALTKGPQDPRRILYDSLGLFVASYMGPRVEGQRAEMQLIALDNDEALDASETAVALWQSLISAPLSQLVAWHGSGVRQEDVASIVVQLLGLGAIGTGVNR